MAPKTNNKTTSPHKGDAKEDAKGKATQRQAPSSPAQGNAKEDAKGKAAQRLTPSSPAQGNAKEDSKGKAAQRLALSSSRVAASTTARSDGSRTSGGSGSQPSRVKNAEIPSVGSGSHFSSVNTESMSDAVSMARKIRGQLVHRIDLETALELMGFLRVDGVWTPELEHQSYVDKMEAVAEKELAMNNEWVRILNNAYSTTYKLKVSRGTPGGDGDIPDMEVSLGGQVCGYIELKIETLTDGHLGQLVRYLTHLLDDRHDLAFADGLLMAGHGPSLTTAGTERNPTATEVRFVRLLRNGHILVTGSEKFDSLLIEAFFSRGLVAAHCLPFRGWRLGGVKVEYLTAHGSSAFVLKITDDNTKVAWAMKYIHSGNVYRPQGDTKTGVAFNERTRHKEAFGAVLRLKTSMSNTGKDFNKSYADVPRVYDIHEVPEPVKSVACHYGIPLEYCVVTDWAGDTLGPKIRPNHYVKVAQTLGYIYETCELAHCDARPANIAISGDDHVSILDWGECQQLDKYGQWKVADDGYKEETAARSEYSYHLAPWFLSRRQLWYLRGVGPGGRTFGNDGERMIATTAEDEAEFLAKAMMCAEDEAIWAGVKESMRTTKAFWFLDLIWRHHPAYSARLHELKTKNLEMMQDGRKAAQTLAEAGSASGSGSRGGGGGKGSPASGSNSNSEGKGGQGSSSSGSASGGGGGGGGSTSGRSGQGRGGQRGRPLPGSHSEGGMGRPTSGTNSQGGGQGGPASGTNSQEGGQGGPTSGRNSQGGGMGSPSSGSSSQGGGKGDDDDNEGAGGEGGGSEGTSAVQTKEEEEEKKKKKKQKRAGKKRQRGGGARPTH